jgi:hypothetical protein
MVLVDDKDALVNRIVSRPAPTWPTAATCLAAAGATEGKREQ